MIEDEDHAVKAKLGLDQSSAVVDHSKRRVASGIRISEATACIRQDGW